MKKKLCLFFSISSCQLYDGKDPHIQDRKRISNCLPMPAWFTKYVSAVSWELEATRPQARPAVANLRSHECWKTGTAAVNGGHVDFKSQTMKVTELWDFAVQADVPSLTSGLFFLLFFSNELVLDSLSASEMWETINYDYSFFLRQ